MDQEKKPPPAYKSVIDLTTRAQEQKKREAGASAFQQVDDAIPAATVADLSPAIRDAVGRAGWTELTEVQRRAIPHMLKGDDLVVQSRTGSGKTGAFLLPLFDRIDPTEPGVQVLVLAPTRELARQIHEEFERMRPDEDRWRAAIVYGGVRYGQQRADLGAGVPVVIGTPGRVLDHLEQKTFGLSRISVFVLDEADEMLSMGFYPAMMKLKRFLPEVRTSYMFSATIPSRVRHIANEFLNDPVFLGLSSGQEAVDTMEHRYCVVNKMDKDRALIRILEMENPESAIIFANTKRDVEYLAQFLKNYGHDADGLSGDLSQTDRERVMKKIRDGALRFLVSTDVAARGIDISDLSHVIMYDVPQDPEYYIHRSGRTARAGKEGIVLALATVEDERTLLATAQRFAVELEKQMIPSDEEVTERLAERLTVLLEQILRDMRNLERERMGRFTPLVKQLANEEPELLAMLLDRFYHEQLHKPAEVGAEPSADERRDNRPPPNDQSRQKGSGGGRRRRDKRRK